MRLFIKRYSFLHDEEGEEEEQQRGTVRYIGVCYINMVAICCAGFILGWVTMYGLNSL